MLSRQLAKHLFQSLREFQSWLVSSKTEIRLHPVKVKATHTKAKATHHPKVDFLEDRTAPAVLWGNLDPLGAIGEPVTVMAPKVEMVSTLVPQFVFTETTSHSPETIQGPKSAGPRFEVLLDYQKSTQSPFAATRPASNGSSSVSKDALFTHLGGLKSENAAKAFFLNTPSGENRPDPVALTAMAMIAIPLLRPEPAQDAADKKTRKKRVAISSTIRI